MAATEMPVLTTLIRPHISGTLASPYIFSANRYTSSPKKKIIHPSVWPITLKTLTQILSLIFRLTGADFQSLGEILNNEHPDNLQLPGTVPSQTRYDNQTTRVRRNSPANRDQGPNRPPFVLNRSIVRPQEHVQIYRDTVPERAVLSPQVPLRSGPFVMPVQNQVKLPTSTPKPSQLAQMAPMVIYATTGVDGDDIFAEYANPGETAVNFQNNSSKKMFPESSGSDFQHIYPAFEDIIRGLEENPEALDGVIVIEAEDLSRDNEDGQHNDETIEEVEHVRNQHEAVTPSTDSSDHDDDIFYMIDEADQTETPENLETIAGKSEGAEMKAEDEQKAVMQTEDKVKIEEPAKSQVKAVSDIVSEKADAMNKPEEKGPAPEINILFDNPEKIDGHINSTENEIDKKFARRVPPCQERLVLSPVHISNKQRPDIFDPSQFKNWEYDFMREIQNRFYNCCLECKKKLLDNLTCNCTDNTSNPSPQIPFPDPPTDRTPPNTGNSGTTNPFPRLPPNGNTNSTENPNARPFPNGPGERGPPIFPRGQLSNDAISKSRFKNEDDKTRNDSQLNLEAELERLRGQVQRYEAKNASPKKKTTKAKHAEIAQKLQNIVNSLTEDEKRNVARYFDIKSKNEQSDSYEVDEQL